MHKSMHKTILRDEIKTKYYILLNLITKSNSNLAATNNASPVLIARNRKQMPIEKTRQPEMSK